jgi:hypothetical protein
LRGELEMELRQQLTFFSFWLAVCTLLVVSTPSFAVPINCSNVFCTSADQANIGGYSMFNENNFDPVTDGFNRTRKFWIHIPDDYDAVDGVSQMIPVIFAFHGGGQLREAMVNGKWGDYFDQDIAFVIPSGEPDPCDNFMATGQSQWLGPGAGASTSSGNPNCDPASQVVDGFGDTLTYWNASLTGTFTDVLFIEQLRAIVLDRFPKLNPNKVYATGFSAGGGMTLSLLCYRANLFRGFSVVAKTLQGVSQRGDFNWDGVDDTDPDSLVATCGKSFRMAGHATGIAAARLWGEGTFFGPFGSHVRVTKPVALFVGDQDGYTVKTGPGMERDSTEAENMQRINESGNMIRFRNNLNGSFFVQNPFLDTAMDDATTQRRTFITPLDAKQTHSTFRRFLVQGDPNHSATHAMPDAQECPPVNASFGDEFMTCDYDYTDQTRIFFEQHADLNLNP